MEKVYVRPGEENERGGGPQRLSDTEQKPTTSLVPPHHLHPNSTCSSISLEHTLMSAFLNDVFNPSWHEPRIISELLSANKQSQILLTGPPPHTQTKGGRARQSSLKSLSYHFSRFICIPQ